MILGFSGRARHGKTIACEAIKRHVESAAAVYEGKIRTGEAKIYDIGNIIRLYCIANGLLPQVERKDMTREQLQILIDVGREKRAINDNYWIGQMYEAIDREGMDVALIPNLRYWNEAEGVRARKGHVIRCERLNADGSPYLSPDRDPNDPSETGLLFWPADFYLTTKPNQEAFMAMQAVNLYRFLKGYTL